MEKFIEGVEKYFNNKYGVSIDDITDNDQIEDAWVNVEDNIIDAVEEFCEYLAEKYDLTPINNQLY